MLLVLALLFGLAWVAGFTVFHATSSGLHVFVVLALVTLLIHIHRMGRRSL